LLMFLVASRIPTSQIGRLLAGGAILSSLPAFSALVQGQVSIIMALGVFAGLAALTHRRDILAGVLLAVLTIKLTYALPVVLVLYLGGRRRAAASLAATALALTAASALVLPLKDFTGYATILSEATHWGHGHRGFDASTNESWNGFWHLLLPGTAGTAAWIVCSIAGLVCLAYIAHRFGATPGVMALSVVAGLLLSPHVLVHDLLLLVIPVTCLGTSRQFTARMAVLWPLVWLAPYLSLAPPFGVPIQWPALATTAVAAAIFASIVIPSKHHESLREPRGAVA